jgi:hypothetical protein
MDAEDKRQVLPLLAAITGLTAGVFSFLVFLVLTANVVDHPIRRFAQQ